MCCGVQNGNNENAVCLAICGVGALVVLGTITMLVMGILGATGAVPMAPIGARLMIGISTAIIIGLIGGAIRTCCCGR